MQKQIIQEHEILILIGEGREKFIETLLNPPAPNSALIKAFKRYQKEVVSIDYNITDKYK